MLRFGRRRSSALSLVEPLSVAQTLRRDVGTDRSKLGIDRSKLPLQRFQRLLDPVEPLKKPVNVRHQAAQLLDVKAQLFRGRRQSEKSSLGHRRKNFSKRGAAPRSIRLECSLGGFTGRAPLPFHQIMKQRLGKNEAARCRARRTCPARLYRIMKVLPKTGPIYP